MDSEERLDHRDHRERVVREESQAQQVEPDPPDPLAAEVNLARPGHEAKQDPPDQQVTFAFLDKLLT